MSIMGTNYALFWPVFKLNHLILLLLRLSVALTTVTIAPITTLAPETIALATMALVTITTIAKYIVRPY